MRLLAMNLTESARRSVPIEQDSRDKTPENANSFSTFLPFNPKKRSDPVSAVCSLVDAVRALLSLCSRLSPYGGQLPLGISLNRHLRNPLRLSASVHSMPHKILIKMHFPDPKSEINCNSINYSIDFIECEVDLHSPKSIFIP